MDSLWHRMLSMEKDLTLPRQLPKESRKIMKPSGEDLEILDNRCDDKFSQKVRNIKSHNTLAEKVYTEGERNRKWYLK